jgi:tetratricopeptide (TPR) repeat protein
MKINIRHPKKALRALRGNGFNGSKHRDLRFQEDLPDYFDVAFVPVKKSRRPCPDDIDISSFKHSSPDRQISILKEYFRTNPLNRKNVWALCAMGACYMDKSTLYEADKYYSRAFRIDPNNKHAMEGRVRVELLRGNHDDAEELCNDFLRHTPEETIAFILLAEIALARGNDQKAEELLRKVKNISVIKSIDMTGYKLSKHASIRCSQRNIPIRSILEQVEKGVFVGIMNAVEADIFLAYKYRVYHICLSLRDKVIITAMMTCEMRT